MDLSPGSSIAGRYTVEAVLGRGGFATIYAVRHTLLGSAHALKLLHAHSEEARRRLLAEGRMQARLAHPNIVRVTDVIELDGDIGLVMDRVEGGTLRELLDLGRLPLPRALALAHAILDAVAAAHEAQLIHRDLKPANVLIGAHGEPHVTDFGLARAQQESMQAGAHTETGIGMGTPGYMAPEAYEDVASVDARADVYALGVMLFELFSGAQPYSGSGFMNLYRQAREGRLADIMEYAPELPKALVDAVRAALQPRPEDRPANAGALARLLSGEQTTGQALDEAVIERLVAPPVPQIEPAHPTTPLPKVRLPLEHDSFIGRDAQLQALREALREARLVTLLGPGGTGKTRLATHLGWQVAGDWPGGVIFCDLSEARSLDGVLSALARALDLALGRGEPLIQLGSAIRGRERVLLILDNFEQITTLAASTVGAWLDQAPEAHFLVTSRERLHLRGEQLVDLEPLDAESATQLFIQRAKAQDLSLVFDRSNLDHVAAIVQALDGLPLAIELAAARVRLLPPAKLRERLRERFKVLSGPVGASRRQATLRAAIDWSWELLSPPERAALAQLSVFVGDFSVEAVEAVLDPESCPDALDLLQALLDKSLVRRVAAGRPGMLGSVQEYAAEKLSLLGLRAAAEARHGAWCAQLGEEGGSAGRGEELENLVAAVERAIQRADGVLAAEALDGAWAALSLRGPFARGASLALAVTALLPAEHPRSLGAQRIAATALYRGGKLEQARAQGEAALASARRLNNRQEEAKILSILGDLDRDRGELDAARAHFEQALSIARACGDRRVEAAMGVALGYLVLEHGDSERARTQLMGALDLSRQAGDARVEVKALGLLGTIAVLRGELDEAQRTFEQVLEINRALGDRHAEGVALGHLGNLLREQGQHVRARTRYERALTLHREVGFVYAQPYWLYGLALIDAESGRLDEALSEAQEAIRLAEPVPLVHAEVLSALARVYMMRRETPLARAAIVAARRLDQPVGVSALVAAVDALVCLTESDPESARACLGEATADPAFCAPTSEVGKLVAMAQEVLEQFNTRDVATTQSHR